MSTAPTQAKQPEKDLPWWLAAGIVLAVFLLGYWLLREQTWLDRVGTWVAIKFIYRQEWWLLPLVAIALVLLPENRAFWMLKVIVSAVLVCYLLFFLMHWYSWRAWPIVAASVGFIWSRRYWYRAIGLLPLATLALQQLAAFLFTSEKRSEAWSRLRNSVTQMHWRRKIASGVGTVGALAALAYVVPISSLLALAAALLFAVALMWWAVRGVRLWQLLVAAGVFVAWYFLIPIPAELLWWLCIALTLTAGLLVVLGMLKGGDAALADYLDSDPRMVRYLDSVRLLLRKPKEMSTLASDRLDHLVTQQAAEAQEMDVLAPRPNAWGSLFTWACRTPGVVELLGLYARWNPVTSPQSRYVEDRVAYARDKAWTKWCALERDAGAANVPPAADETLPKLKALVGGLWQWLRAALLDESRRTDVPEETAHRLRWLALTEALAECYAFTDEDEEGRRRALGLLQHAATIQYSIAHDLERTGKSAAFEFRLALHFLNLLSRLLEAFVDKAPPHGGASLKLRSDDFCARLQEMLKPDRQEVTKDDWNKLPYRIWLVWLYVLMGRLQQRLPETKGDAELAEWFSNAGEAQSLFECASKLVFKRRWDLQLAVGQAQSFALVALDLRRGDVARAMLSATTFMCQTDRSLSADPLHRAIEKLKAAAREQALDLAPFFWLWGRSIEEELDHARAGSQVWGEHVWQAASFYHRAQSQRLRHLSALCAAVPAEVQGASEIVELV